MAASGAALTGLRERFDQAERQRQDAADAERSAFERWQDAYAAHELARDDASAAWVAWSEGIAGL